MKDISLKEFKPTILFLIKFVGLYLLGNVLYGAYVTAYDPRPDPVTHSVTAQVAEVLSTCGFSATIADRMTSPTTTLVYEERSVLSVYEGCNGLNAMIIFVAFVVAFGPLTKTVLWFIPTGLVIIHLLNLVRIGLLFFVSRYLPGAMYFTHKYFFTAFLYLVIFLLWVWWVKKFSARKT